MTTQRRNNLIPAPWRQNNHPDTTEASPDFNKKQLPFLPNLPASVQLGDEVGGIQVWRSSLITFPPDFTILCIRHGSISTTPIWWAWQRTTCQVFTLWPPHLPCLTGAGKPCWHFDKLLSICNCICHCVCVSIENRKQNYDFCGRGEQRHAQKTKIKTVWQEKWGKDRCDRAFLHFCC